MLVALRHLHPFWKEYANRKAFSMQMSSSHPTHHNLEIGSSHNWSWCDEVINWLWCFDFFDILDNSAYHSVNKSQIHWGMLFELQSLKWGSFHLRDIFLLLSPENKVLVLLSQVLGPTLFPNKFSSDPFWTSKMMMSPNSANFRRILLDVLEQLGLQKLFLKCSFHFVYFAALQNRGSTFSWNSKWYDVV